MNRRAVQQQICTSAQKEATMQDIEKIRNALQDRVVTAVSDATGVNRNTIAEIKNGKKNIASKSTLNLLARYLGTDQ